MAGAAQHESFWDFSIRTYSQANVRQACLSLQNDHGADVNMVLYSCWISGRVGQFDDGLLTSACEFSKRWAKHVVVPLRRTRTWMKHSGCIDELVPDDSCLRLRDEVKNVELGSEKLQQQVLESLVPVDAALVAITSETANHAIANLNQYAAMAGIEVNKQVSQKFATVIDAAFPEI